MLADRFTKLIETGDRAAVEEFYAPGALLDANVPTWRFQRKGIDEIASQFAEWSSAGAPEIISMREWTAPFGAVVEFDQREPTPSGGSAYARQLHLLFTEGDKVTRHVMYCTGPWDAETEARQHSDAPMYEP